MTDHGQSPGELESSWICLQQSVSEVIEKCAIKEKTYGVKPSQFSLDD